MLKKSANICVIGDFLTVFSESSWLSLIQVLKGLSHEIDFKNVDENGQNLALLRAAAGY